MMQQVATRFLERFQVNWSGWEGQKSKSVFCVQGRIIVQGGPLPKRDIVDTTFHASCVRCHNRYKQISLPTSWGRNRAGAGTSVWVGDQLGYKHFWVTVGFIICLTGGFIYACSGYPRSCLFQQDQCMCFNPLEAHWAVYVGVVEQSTPG